MRGKDRGFSILTFGLTSAALLLAGNTTASAASHAQTYQVRHKHFPVGSCQGKLTVSKKGITYQGNTNVKHSREWEFKSIEKFTRKNPYSLSITPFSGGRYLFALLQKGMSDADFTATADQVGGDRGLFTYSRRKGQSYRVQHKHFPTGSCTGKLVATGAHLYFESNTNVGHSRDWELKGIKQFMRKSPFILEVKPFNGKEYDFQLQEQGMSLEDYEKIAERIGSIPRL